MHFAAKKASLDSYLPINSAVVVCLFYYIFFIENRLAIGHAAVYILREHT